MSNWNVTTDVIGINSGEREKGESLDPTASVLRRQSAELHSASSLRANGNLAFERKLTQNYSKTLALLIAKNRLSRYQFSPTMKS